MNLFLDDERKPSDVKWLDLPPVTWTIVKSYDEFVRAVKTHGVPAMVSLDHDLAYPEHYAHGSARSIPYHTYKTPTGWHAAVWLYDHCQKTGANMPQSFVHTLNGTGRQNIIRALQGNKLVL